MKYLKFDRSQSLLLTLVLGMGLLSSCDLNMELVQSIDQEFEGINSIEIESGFLDVNYQGQEGASAVDLTAALESSRPGRFTIEYRVEEDKLVIFLERHGSGTGNHRGYVNLTGPMGMNMDIEVGSGNIRVQEVESPEFNFEGGSGNLTLAGIHADEILLKISSGKIEADDLTGNVALEISSGNARVTDLDGNINAVGSSGNFTFDRVTGVVNSALNSGNGKLDRVQEIGKLKISSGNYTVSDSYLGPNTILEGNSGNFRIQTDSDLADFNFDLRSSSGNLKVGESRASKVLKIDNGSPYTVSGVVSSGNIEIRN
ncbi:DUF4097 domain-containing protein [Algoriphagus halophytocola]|uniref:DUF4097 domain-containing protein n=1 Tax=Algoriphagus halophytocola TaxID=2991499 RepID=A0ABY6MN40_9BACT|nr:MULTISPECIES: DUF4097 domain-containing protein [unclassified Algoriphagus]UZD23812.1 DUF4097 domain-containing protein [Algoriphagus sp. TR-M5]WBL41179.1 DUF4097 domain-containing protein [Algoriphagus sp. TR-M9]